MVRSLSNALNEPASVGMVLLAVLGPILVLFLLIYFGL